MLPNLYIPSFHLGPFPIHPFGMLVATGVILGSYLSVRQARKYNLDDDLLIDGIYWIVPGGFVISHLFAVLLYYPERIAKDPWLLLKVWNGIASFGANFA